MAKATVAISQDFFNSFAALPKSKQNKVMDSVQIPLKPGSERIQL